MVHIGPIRRDEGTRILILEDMGADAELMERTLRSSGLEFEVRQVVGRDSFQRELDEFAPHLVLSDYEMPRYTGMDAIRAVQERCPSTPIIIVTGAVGEEAAVRCIKAGAEDYVLKDHLIRLPSAVASALKRRRERDLRSAAESTLRILSLTVKQSPAAIMITDTEGCIEYVNPKFTRLTGYAAEEVIGRNPRFLKSGHTSPEEYQRLWKTITSGRVWRGEFCDQKKSGELCWLDATIAPILDPDRTITHFVAVSEDITVRKDYEERLLRQANFDELTGLPNRLLALDRLSQAVAGARRDRKLGAVLLVDLDRFQIVNDSLSFQAGDALLKRAARRFVSCVRECDTVARLGGDEFLLVLQNRDGPAETEAVAREILTAFSRPFTLEGQEFLVTASIGISTLPNRTDDPHILLREADSAMFKAKERGGDCYQFFVSEMNIQLRERLNVESRLRHAMERGELSLHYQPMIELGSDRVIGAEALMRWDNPELGSVSPGVFAPIAEQAGLMVPMGEWALRTACREAVQWEEILGQPVHVGVNVSSAQFSKGDFVQTVGQALEESGLPPHLLNLEITETLVMADTSAAGAILQQLGEMGVSLALDDFGTGYSSLAYLRRLPVNTLKIDRLFIQDMTTDPDAANLIAGIIGLAHGLGRQVVAEGVETSEQLDYVRSLNCDLAQGFYFSEPLPATEFREQLRRGSSWAVSGAPCGDSAP